jgi:hypothetical protein
MDTVTVTGNRIGSSSNGEGVYYNVSGSIAATWKDVDFFNQLYITGSGTGDFILESPVLNGAAFSGSGYTVAITKGLFNTGALSFVNIKGVIKDGVRGSSIRVYGGAISLVNVLVNGGGIGLYDSSRVLLLNTSLTGGISCNSWTEFQLQVYNSRIMSTSQTFTVFGSPLSPSLIPLIVRNSLIPGAQAGDTYQDSYMSLADDSAVTIFPGATVTTEPANNPAYAVPVDMTDFVDSEQNQGSNSYYPATAAAFNTMYYNGELSQAVVEFLQKDWDKDLAGNPRFKGSSIDVGPYEVE